MIRPLTIDEMLEQEDGDEAVLLIEYYGKPVGTPIKRRKAYRDDHDSVAYFYDDNQFHFFEEGDVGVSEVTAHKHTGGVTGEETKAPELGVYRPELETRKIGKIRVELVDDGFPLALREVANVMTWAQTAKGYKDHDWQNLPNAEIALAAAASRHRTDHIKQRVVEGFDIDECVDVESGLLHKAHEAFGVLAQLELMLRGKFVDSRQQFGV